MFRCAAAAATYREIEHDVAAIARNATLTISTTTTTTTTTAQAILAFNVDFNFLSVLYAKIREQ